jgi:hypothetical protein
LTALGLSPFCSKRQERGCDLKLTTAMRSADVGPSAIAISLSCRGPDYFFIITRLTAHDVSPNPLHTPGLYSYCGDSASAVVTQIHFPLLNVTHPLEHRSSGFSGEGNSDPVGLKKRTGLSIFGQLGGFAGYCATAALLAKTENPIRAEIKYRLCCIQSSIWLI